MSITSTEANGHPLASTAEQPLELSQIDIENAGTTSSNDRAGSSAAAAIFGDKHALDPTAVRAALATAAENIAVQDSPELRQAKDPQEIQHDIDQSRRHRAADRAEDDKDHKLDIEQRQKGRKKRKTELAAQRKHDAKMAAIRRKHEHSGEKAQALRDRLTDPVTELKRLRWALRSAPWMALTPAAVAAVVGTINVGQQAQRITGLSGWGGAIGYGVEILFTLPLVAILIAQLCGAVTSGTPVDKIRTGLRDEYATAERVLLAIAVVLNSVSHLLPSADGSPHNRSAAVLFLAVPIGLWLSMWLAPLLQNTLTARFAQSARAAQLSASAGVFSGDQAKSLRLLRWVAEQDQQGLIPGERNEETGMPSAKGVAKAIREHFGSCSQTQAREILDAYGVLQGKL